MRPLQVSVAVFVLSSICALAQVPVIESGGVQNAASNLALTSIAPQMLIAIKGQHLASSTQTAAGPSLPYQLGGATVMFNGPNGMLRAPLLYASETQINAQVPNGIAGTSLVVTTAAGSSAPYVLPLVTGADPFRVGSLGIFTQDASGCGQAAAYNIHPDGSLSLNTPQNSLDPETDLGLAIFGTGLGGLEFSDRQNAVPWTFNPADNLVSQYVSSGAGLTNATLGAPGYTATSGKLSVQYLGPAPGRVAIDQANVLGQWKSGPQGCRVPLSLSLFQPQVVNNGVIPGFAPPPDPLPVSFTAFDATQLVDVSIQPGGGICTDPDSGLGIVTWQKTTVSDFGGTAVAEAVTAEFIQSDGLGFPQPGAIGVSLPPAVPNSLNNTVYGPLSTPPPACAASLPSTLDAGGLTLSGSGIGSVSLERSTQNGRLTYQAALTPGTLHGGGYRVVGQGGSQVGAFTANANIPAPISGIAVTSPSGQTSPSPGTLLEPPCQITGIFGFCHGGYSVTWIGGDNRSAVTVQFIVGNTFQAVAAANGGDGVVIIPSAYGPYPDYCNLPSSGTCTLMPSGTVEIIITQTPHQGPSQAFQAPGLAWGGEGAWKYVWDFRGLSNE